MSDEDALTSSAEPKEKPVTTKPSAPVNISEKFQLIHDRWSPKIVAQINDLHFKAVKIEGTFVWHSHDDTDEFFLVHRGRMTIEMTGHDDVTLEAGEFFVVPRGVEHRPVADDPCEVLLLEPAGVVNTGEVTDSNLTARDEWI